MVNKKNVFVDCSCRPDCVDTLQDTQMNKTSDCSCGPGCCDASTDMKAKNKRIIIDFLYLDLSVCTRCQGTDTNLDEALAEVSKVLEATGVEVILNKINVLSEELARQHRFISSPTIRVNGHDIQMDAKESLCESCGDLCGDEVDCRVWVYQGKEYTIPPKAMIIEAILKEVYGNESKDNEEKEFILPENLKHFYESMKVNIESKQTKDSCCSSSKKEGCC